MFLHDDHFPFCTRKIDEIYFEFAPQRAQTIINGALDEFAVRLSVLECAGKQNKRAAIRKAVDALVSIGQQIGLGSLTDAAHNMRALTASSDDPALAAAEARLVRPGDMCLVPLRAIQDQKKYTALAKTGAFPAPAFLPCKDRAALQSPQGNVYL
jgi:hypothetical protein